MSADPSIGPARAKAPTGRRYAGRSAEERRQARRAALVDAAYELFGTAGYQHVTIERLCSHARLTARNFYEAFGDREALLQAVYDRTITAAAEAVGGALAQAGPTVRQRARAGLGAFVHALLDDPRAARIVCLEVIGVSDALERHRRTFLHAFADGIADEYRGLTPTPVPDPAPAALALVGGVHELITDWLHSDDRLPLDTLVAIATDLFVAASTATTATSSDS